MKLMFLGLMGLSAVAAAVHLFNRRRALLGLRSQLLGARHVLEDILRQRQELAQVWCALCGERGLLPDHLPALRKSLARLAPALGEARLRRPAPAFPAADRNALLDARLVEEMRLSRLIRQGFALFLEGFSVESPSANFFRQYFRSLARLEKEIGDAQELYNDAAAVYNRALGGLTGRALRVLTGYKPQTALSSSQVEARPRRWTAKQPWPGESLPADRPASPASPEPAVFGGASLS